MSDIVLTVAESLASLGVDAGKNYVKGIIDEKKLKASLMSYIERQKKYNEICSLAEEIDFQGLVEYIHDNLLDEVNKRITSIKTEERRNARKKIVDAAVTFSKANTEKAKARVAKNIAKCLDIIKDFYSKKVDVQYYVLATEVVDAINENTTDAISKAANEVKEEIKSEADRLLSEFSRVSFYPDPIVGEAAQGKIGDINYGIKFVLNQLSATHPLFPYYGFDWKDGSIVSKPLSAEANVKYPSKYSFTGPIKIGNKYITDPSMNILNYAYRHQLQIVMNVEDAKKYLGDVIDPAQYEVQSMVGMELYAKPPEFPPAFACSIKVKDQVCFEYLLIRTQEILDDGTCILSNIEQPNTHIRFEFRVNIKGVTERTGSKNFATKSDASFKISIHNETNSERLKFIKFIKSVATEGDLRLHVLENDKDLIAGKVNSTNYPSGLKDIDKEIDFFERICDIEHYFGKSLHIEGNISEQEYHTVLFISDLIRNDQIEETWDNASFTGVIDDRFRKILIEIGDKMGAISYVCTSHIDIFGVHLELKFMRTFYDAIMEDHENILKIAELSKDGDPIRITFRAGDSNRAVSTIHLPENVR